MKATEYQEMIDKLLDALQKVETCALYGELSEIKMREIRDLLKQRALRIQHYIEI